MSWGPSQGAGAAGIGRPVPFEIVTTPVDGSVRVSFRGELDLASVDRFRQALLAALAPGHAVVVDLGGVGFMDSTGLAAIIEIAARAQETRVTLDFSLPLPPQPMRLMALTGMLERLGIEADRGAEQV